MGGCSTEAPGRKAHTPQLQSAEAESSRPPNPRAGLGCRSSAVTSAPCQMLVLPRSNFVKFEKVGAVLLPALRRADASLADRQEACHLHQIRLCPTTNQWALACDLGADTIVTYKADPTTAKIKETSRSAEPNNKQPNRA